jgi:hypothetical protein
MGFEYKLNLYRCKILHSRTTILNLIYNFLQKALTQVTGVAPIRRGAPARRVSGIRGKFLAQKQRRAQQQGLRPAGGQQRRGGRNGPSQTSVALNTLNQRSRMIGRQRRAPRQQIVALPTAALVPSGGRPQQQRRAPRRQPIQYVPVIQGPRGPVAM